MPENTGSSNSPCSNPRFSSVDGTKWVDYRNNVVYNWGFKTAYGGGHHGEINMVGNYYKPGPASQHHRLLDVAEDGTGRYYVAENVMEGDDTVTYDNHRAVMDRFSCLVGSPFPYEPIEEDIPVVAYHKILKEVGCSFSRDMYDKEVLRQVKKGLGTFGLKGIINSPKEVGGWPVLKVGKPLRDTDADGVPDVWERRYGLNADDASDASTYTLDKNYTNIEIYLNGLLEK